jgi:hypothetical protein
VVDLSYFGVNCAVNWLLFLRHAKTNSFSFNQNQLTPAVTCVEMRAYFLSKTKLMVTKKRSLTTAIIISLLTSLAACESQEVSQSPGSSLKDEGPTVSSEQQVVPIPMNLKGQIAFAKKDLVQRLDASPESVKLSGASQVTWRSGALGCPVPGMNYTEALVPGSVIYLQVGKVMHAYHAKVAGEPFYCPRERVESPVAGEEGDLT